jgi:hypothetical protein
MTIIAAVVTTNEATVRGMRLRWREVTRGFSKNASRIDSAKGTNTGLAQYTNAITINTAMVVSGATTRRRRDMSGEGRSIARCYRKDVAT